LSARGTAQPAAGPSRDDCLLVGGVPLTHLAERVGRTPFYAYDRASCDARVGELRRHLPPMVKLHYAMKANPMPSLVVVHGRHRRRHRRRLGRRAHGRARLRA
jgi:hypothetical protein